MGSRSTSPESCSTLVHCCDASSALLVLLRVPYTDSLKAPQGSVMALSIGQMPSPVLKGKRTLDMLPAIGKCPDTFGSALSTVGHIMINEA